MDHVHILTEGVAHGTSENLYSPVANRRSSPSPCLCLDTSSGTGDQYQTPSWMTSSEVIILPERLPGRTQFNRQHRVARTSVHQHRQLPMLRIRTHWPMPTMKIRARHRLGMTNQLKILDGMNIQRTCPSHWLADFRTTTCGSWSDGSTSRCIMLELRMRRYWEVSTSILSKTRSSPPINLERT